MDLESEKTKRDQRLKTKRERISVDTSTAGESARSVVPQVKDEVKPKEEIQRAKGASGKRRRDESALEKSTGTE